MQCLLTLKNNSGKNGKQLLTMNLTGVNQLTNRLLPLDFPPQTCHTNSMNKTPIRFNSNGVYASDARLASIAAECIAAERAAVAARRAARAAGAQESTWLVNW